MKAQHQNSRVGLPFRASAGKHRNAGYTLTEMIIAMVLVSALMSTVWGVMSLYNGLLTAGRDRTSQQQLVRSLFELINEDLTAVNADATAPLLSEFGDAFADSAAEEDNAFEAPSLQGPTRQLASGTLSVTGSATALRLQIRAFVPPDISPPSDIDLLNELGGGSASVQQASRRVSEFQTVVYQIVPWGQNDSVNSGAERLSPGLYRVQADAQSMASLEAGQSTAEQLRQASPIEISKPNLLALANPQQVSARDLLEEQLTTGSVVHGQVDTVPEVVACQFEYFDGKAWQSSWDENSTLRIPVAVRISLDVVEGKDLARLEELYPSAGTQEPGAAITTEADPADESFSYSVSAKRYSRTILLDSTVSVDSGGLR